jgi:hypothetical protein
MPTAQNLLRLGLDHGFRYHESNLGHTPIIWGGIMFWKRRSLIQKPVTARFTRPTWDEKTVTKITESNRFEVHIIECGLQRRIFTPDEGSAHFERNWRFADSSSALGPCQNREHSEISRSGNKGRPNRGLSGLRYLTLSVPTGALTAGSRGNLEGVIWIVGIARQRLPRQGCD